MKLVGEHRKKPNIIGSWNHVLSLLCSFITTVTLALNLDIVAEETISNTVITGSRLVRFITVLYLSLSGFGLQHIIILAALYFFYRNIYCQDEYGKRKKCLALTAAVIFTLFILVGNSYYKTQSAILLTYNYAQIGKNIIAFSGYVILFYAFVNWIWHCLDTIIYGVQSGSLSHGKFMRLTHRALGNGRTSFTRSFIIIMVVYLPYIIISYPACFTGDTSWQLSQVFGLTGYSDHHPICHTLFLGSCVKIGEAAFHSKNAGLFIYVLLQCLIMVFVLSYSIYRIMLTRFSFLGLPVLAGYCFLPFFQIYSACIEKDSIWAPFLLLWNIEFLDIIEKHTSRISNKSFYKLFTLSVLVCLFRKNGIYLVLLSGFTILFVLQKQRKHIIAFLVCIITFFQLFNGVCLPYFQVMPGSKKEMLSVPFQQTARYVCTFPDEVTNEEKEAIAKILDYDSLAEKYNPELSDPVKSTFRDEATSEELKAYFVVWFQMFLKHPGTYISATVNNYYSYFHFSRIAPLSYRSESSQRYMDNLKAENSSVFQDVTHYYGSDFINELRNFIFAVQNSICRFPGISFLMTASIYQWIMLLIIGYLFVKRYYRGLVAYIPVLSILLVNLAGPTNGTYFRYEYPIVFCLPYIVAWTMNWIVVQKETGNVSKKSTDEKECLANG